MHFRHQRSQRQDLQNLQWQRNLHRWLGVWMLGVSGFWSSSSACRFYCFLSNCSIVLASWTSPFSASNPSSPSSLLERHPPLARLFLYLCSDGTSTLHLWSILLWTPIVCMSADGCSGKFLLCTCTYLYHKPCIWAFLHSGSEISIFPFLCP